MSGVEAERLAYSFAQFGRSAVRILFKMLRERRIGSYRLGLVPSGVSLEDNLNTLPTLGAVLLPGI